MIRKESDPKTGFFRQFFNIIIFKEKEGELKWNQ